VQQGLLEEARNLYESILAQQEDYEPARAKLAELAGAKRSEGKPKKVVPVKAPDPIVQEEPRRPKGTERVLKEVEAKVAPNGSGDSFFDLYNELQDEIQELEQELSKPKIPEEEEYLSPEEVISEFKRGVARTVAKDDYQTHYNLGIAYKEMG